MFRSMGHRTSVEPNQSAETEPRSAGSSGAGLPGGKSVSQGRSIQLKIDGPLLLVVAMLLIFGLLLVYSASYDPAFRVYKDAFYIIRRQAMFMALGVVLAIAFAFFDYHNWRRLVVPAMGFTIVALLAVLWIGESRQGAVRTLMSGSVQPSELAKLITVLYLSVWLFAKKDQIQKISFGLLPLAIILGLLGGLIYVQPDLSAVITIMILGGLMFFLAGGDLRQIAILCLTAVLMGWVVIQLSDTGFQRISEYMSGLRDPMMASAHVRRSLEAFVNGGLFGMGIGKGQTKLTGLPVPHTDSIFAVVGEETGILGALGLLILFIILLWRGMKIAKRAPDELGALMAAGLTIWIAFEAFINMAVMLNVLPFAGNALPFISSGGSSLVVSLIGIGILLNISRLGVKTREENGRSFSEVVNLRWRNRRGSLPRPKRTASTD